MSVRKNAAHFGAVALSLSLLIGTLAGAPAFSQGSPNVSMVTLHVQPGQNGQQMVLTPKGMVVPLPGPGVNSDMVQVYMGSNGGYWYVDRNNQPYDLSGYVRAMQGGGGMQQGYSNPPSQNVTVNEQPSSSSGGGGSGLGTAAAAGLGAMTGAAMGAAMTGGYYNNNYPYGTPVYYGGGGAHPYYVNPQGKQVAVSNEYNKTVNVNGLEQQQQWYAQQHAQNSQQYQQWRQGQQTAQNPFVRQQGDSVQPNWQNARQAGAGQGDGGRFGNRSGDQPGGGRFGQRDGGGLGDRNAGDQPGGGRFGQRDGGGLGNRGDDQPGGGRFGQRDGGGLGKGDGGGGFGNREASGGGRFGGGQRGGGGGRGGGRGRR